MAATTFQSSPPGGQRSIEELGVIEAVSGLKARYFRLMDLKQWDDWEALYIDEAVMDVSGEAAAMAQLGFPSPPPDAEPLIWHSAGKIRRNVSAALEGITSVHHGHMPEVEFVSPERVAVIWAMQDIIRYPVGAPTPVPSFNGYGHYHDVYVKRGGQWRIESVKLVRLTLIPVFVSGNNSGENSA